MNTQRLISDARRRAKRLARESGRPHQHHLDEIAVSAGRADWAAFLSEPAPLPEDMEVSVKEACTAEIAEIPAQRGGRAIKWALSTGIGWALVGIATMIVILMLLRTRLPLYGPLADHTDIVAGVIVMVSVPAMMMTAMPSFATISTGLTVTFTRDPDLKADAESLLRIWKGAAARTAVAVVVPAALITLTPVVMSSVPMDDIASYHDDMNAERVRMDGVGRPLALSSRGPGPYGTREIAVVMLDQRISPPQLRAVASPDRFGKEIADTFGRHAVLRMRGPLDCSTGMFRVRSVETADTVAGPAVASVRRMPSMRGVYTVTRESLPTACGDA